METGFLLRGVNNIEPGCWLVALKVGMHDKKQANPLAATCQMSCSLFIVCDTQVVAATTCISANFRYSLVVASNQSTLHKKSNLNTYSRYLVEIIGRTIDSSLTFFATM